MDNGIERTTSNMIYTRRSIRGAAFFGGPFVGAYMMAHNFKVFGTPQKAKRAWLMSVVVFIVVFGFGYIMRSGPETGGKHFPLYLPLMLYAFLISLVVRDYQGEEIERHINRGGAVYGVLPVLGLIILGNVLTIILPGYFLFLAFA